MKEIIIVINVLLLLLSLLLVVLVAASVVVMALDHSKAQTSLSRQTIGLCPQFLLLLLGT